MKKIIIKLLFRKVRVPVDWIHETVDLLDRDQDGRISLGELAVRLRELWKAMRKAKRIAKV